MADRPITKAQIRAIHTLKGMRGLDDDSYRDLLRAECGADSSLDLTVGQANEVLRRLGINGRPGSRPKRARVRRSAANRPEPLPPGVVRMATGRQRELIEELRSEIDWRVADGYDRWLRSNLGIERVTASHHAARVIEGLKAMAKRQRREARSRERPPHRMICSGCGFGLGDGRGGICPRCGQRGSAVEVK